MFAGMMARPRAISSRLALVLSRDRFRQGVASLVFPDRDIFHLRRDDALSRIMHLRHVATRLSPARFPFQTETHLRELGITKAFEAILRSWARQLFRIGAFPDPIRAHGHQAGANVDFGLRIGVRAGGVVDEDRGIFLCAERGGRVGLDDLTHRHKKVAARAFDVDLARVRHRFDRRVVDAGGLG